MQDIGKKINLMEMEGLYQLMGITMKEIGFQEIWKEMVFSLLLKKRINMMVNLKITNLMVEAN